MGREKNFDGGSLLWGGLFQVGGVSKFLAGGGDFFLFFC